MNNSRSAAGRVLQYGDGVWCMHPVTILQRLVTINVAFRAYHAEHYRVPIWYFTSRHSWRVPLNDHEARDIRFHGDGE